ncbi:hypothetical protein AV274_4424 [Blastocystis sp. ATCC 50177/Nand II]|uniref:Hyaluronan/mRNA-binding protein domain-containing protein n=1 Tax=Blastocystis sp. subtype 1 (strain ATCC 50177 / NandII) TaxID=478820 RepID=A0A196SA45_BLAHN|nr:hypothetical protein AV274_4424 [Blastocystis sp. ATCC 50177/Nand II]
MSSENRFASLFEEEEEEVQAAKKEVRSTKTTRTNEKRVGNLRPGKREFDRHSGTGRGREIPKNGSGPRNWGNPKDAKGHLEDETQPLDQSPVPEEEVAEPKPVVFTLEEYEAQRKAKMSELLGKKTARAVEPAEGQKLEKVEEDYFVAEGYKNKEKKGKKVEEEEEPEVILNRRSDDRRDFKRAEGRPQGRFQGRPQGRPQGNRRGPRDEKRSGPKVNVMNEKAFPKL